MRNLAQQAHQLTVQRFGKTIQLFAPLYLSNECIDTCVYCGFSRPLKIERKTLTLQEILEEAAILIKRGFQHLLLVSAEHPKKISPDYLMEIAQALRPKIASLSIEVAPFDKKDYLRLGEAGVDGVVIYQETYDEEIYRQVHVAGPKKDYHHRLRCVEAACQAKIRTVSLGVLLGLAPWQKEIEKLIEHARHLMKHYWQTQFNISLPRLKPCASRFSGRHPVSDEEFEEIICRLRLELPQVGLTLSTREPAILRDRLLKVGITQMSAGSQTEPGGYSNPSAAGKQFELEDLRTPNEVAIAIQNAGYEPVWKDWDARLYG